MDRQVPDTLILAGHAQIALNAMLNVADEDYEAIPFFSSFLQSDAEHPSWMSHGNWDFGSSHGRLVDSIQLVRTMPRTDEGRDMEAVAAACAVRGRQGRPREGKNVRKTAL